MSTLKARISRFLFAALLLCVAGLHAEDDKIHIACVGDSITFGAGVQNREKNAYPVVLGTLLGDKYKSENFGVSGATLLKKGDKPYWNQAVFKQAADFKPNIVVIKLGTNDSKPQNIKSKDDFGPDLAAMVDYFTALPSKPKVFLCLPVPAYGVVYGINEAPIKDIIIPKIKEVAQQKNCPVIDLHTALSDKANLFPDKIHPNAEGAALIAKTVADAIKEAK